MPRRSEAATLQTRNGILRKALDLASVDGLEGLSIGRLADALFMSKSGLFAHFGSKEELQLAVLEAAANAFDTHLRAVTPESRAGLEGLLALAAARLSYLETVPFRGGCLLTALATELDDRPGRLRDRLVELTRRWLGSLSAAAADAIDDGSLHEVEPEQLAFEIHAFLLQANWAFQLHGETEAFRRAAAAVVRCLESCASEAGRRILEERSVLR